MKRSENKELEDLSFVCFGKKYEWKKLTKLGLIIGHDKESGHLRRTPLTVQQAKDYMVKTLEMRKSMTLDSEVKDESR